MYCKILYKKDGYFRTHKIKIFASCVNLKIKQKLLLIQIERATAS